MNYRKGKKHYEILFFIMFIVSVFNYFIKPAADYSLLWTITHGFMVGTIFTAFLFVA